MEIWEWIIFLPILFLFGIPLATAMLLLAQEVALTKNCIWTLLRFASSCYRISWFENR
jgi:hypothetical protein